MLKILKQTFANWLKDDPFTLSAATAYYAVFSIPGLMVLVMAMVSIFFEHAHVEQELMGFLSNTVGDNVAFTVSELIDNLQFEKSGLLTIFVGVITLFFGATGLFIQLQRSLNHIWEVKVKKSASVFKFVKDRFISFSMIIVIGFLLLISLSVTALLNFISSWIVDAISPAFLSVIAVMDFVVSLSVISFLFAVIFKFLPDAKVQWRYALRGGILSAILFNVGEYALNIYFQWVEPASTFGAAGSFILLMLWVFYSCMILLMGAEFAKTSAEMETGKKAEANDIAKKAIPRD